MKKSKKVTLKEFKEVMNKHYPLDIFGYEGWLNIVLKQSIFDMDEADKFNCPATKKAAQERWDDIYGFLKEKGYYDL